jgi:pilus assembly protein CpaE
LVVSGGSLSGQAAARQRSAPLPEMLETVAKPNLPARAERALGSVIAVYGGKGGCGTSFVAANLAASLARVAQQRACIVDLNLQAGDQQLYLGLAPAHSLADVARNFERLDEELLASYLAPRGQGLSLLAAPAESGCGVSAEHVERVLALLRTQVDYVVLDVPQTLNAVTLAGCAAADEIVLLLTLDIPAIRGAKRALELFTRLGYDRARIKLVANRYEKTPAFDLKQVERALASKIYATLANDYAAAIASINLGAPLLQAKARARAGLAQDFLALAGSLSGVDTAQTENKARTGRWVFFGRR